MTDGLEAARAREAARWALPIVENGLRKGYLADPDGELWRKYEENKAAIDGAPWEPSEEQVERAARAMLRCDGDEWSFDGGLADSQSEHVRKTYRLLARAALKAALGLESGSAG